MRHVSLEDPGDLEQVAHLFRRLRPLAEPLPRLLLVHLDVRRLLLRVVRTDPVDKPSVTRAARIGHDYPVEGIALGAVPRQSYLYRHTISSRTVTNCYSTCGPTGPECAASRRPCPSGASSSASRGTA